jgi:peptide/nickel transport system permease protein
VPQRGQRLLSVLPNLFRQPITALGTSIVLLFFVVAALAPLIAPYGLNEQIAEDARQPPSARHLFGTDHLGRDVFSRVVLGAREVLALAGSGSLIAVMLGTAFGLAVGYLGGVVDEVLMRVFDSLLAIPALLLALLLLGTFGPSVLSVLAVIVVIYTPIVTRVVRSAVISLRSMAYVEIARTQGESLGYILYSEILPLIVPALAVEASLRFSYAIFLIASLGFLGIGVQPPSPNWGLMVNEAREFVRQTPWALYVPAAAIAVLVIGVNLTADGLKRALQPR